MLYHLYEWTHAAVKPWRAAASMGRVMLNNPANPISYTYQAKAAAAALDVFDGLTRRYSKPEFGIREVSCHGGHIAISEEIVTRLPFCHLLHFKRDTSRLPERFQTAPKVLVVAPVSGHYATLLRGTVRALLEGIEYGSVEVRLPDGHRLRFGQHDNGNSGTLTYDVNGVTVTKTIERQVFGSFPTECTPP